MFSLDTGRDEEEYQSGTMEDNLITVQSKLNIDVNGTTTWRLKRLELNLLSRNDQVMESINSPKNYHETNCY